MTLFKNRVQYGFLLLFLAFSTPLKAQEHSWLYSLFYSPVDTTFIEDKKEVLTGRLYLGQKYSRFNLVSSNVTDLLDYKPNSRLTMGIGASYDIFTLNIGVPVPAAVNPEKGDTRYLDIQTSVYTSKIIFDIFAQFYKGLFLQNGASFSPAFTDTYYLRPDIYTQLTGLTGYYIFNHKEFSYKAAFMQTQKQLKSAGSFLLGLEVYHGIAEGDSAFVPEFVPSSKNETGVQKFRFFRIGPGGGYAHTFAFGKGFFLLLSLTGNLALGDYKEYDEEGNVYSGFTVDPGVFFRSALGYNTEKWFFGINFTNNAIININREETFSNVFSAGSARLTVAKRFSLKSKTKGTLDKVLPDY